jgi:hypothetical protein
VSLHQFSPVLSGRIGAAGVAVEGLLLRALTPVARFSARTDASGRWGATLRLISSGAPTAVGDDRDVLEVAYGPGGPAPDLIAADGGGNPFNQSGWTSWFDLDHGYAVGNRSVTIAPCSQTGVLTLRVGGRAVGSPVTACQTETDASVVATGSLRAGTGLSLTSTDNRAPWPRNPLGALVSLTVALGEPGSTAAVANRQVLLSPTGFPACAADLRAQRVRCSGLVSGARYTLGGLRALADGAGAATFARPRAWVRGGQVLVLRNRAGRVLTSLHVAHLRVALRGNAVVGGRCEPGAYLGAPVGAPETSAGVGATTVAGSGRVCPLSGALPGGPVEQSDPFSGGLTRTEVPVLAVTSPTPGETLYGPFIAFAQPSPGFGARVTLTVAARGNRRVLRRYRGLERAGGINVSALPRGVYVATWTVTDLNGDTRTTTTLFAQES